MKVINIVTKVMKLVAFWKKINTQRVLRIFCLIRHLAKAFRILIGGKEAFSRINGNRFGQLLLTTDAVAISGQENEALF